MPEQSIISSQIDSILAKRKAKAQVLRARLDKLSRLRELLNEAGSFYNEAEAIEDPQMRAQYQNLFLQIQIPGQAWDLLDEAEQKLRDGIDRFERESLNVATVGRARQGKSTFLQAVGNLDNRVIPAFDAGDCTGAVSIIVNDPDMEPGKVQATLTFRSQAELVDIVKGYIMNVLPEYVETHTISFSRISGNMTLVNDVIAGVKAKNREKTGKAELEARESIQIGHLKNIVLHLSQISGLYGRGPMVLTDPDVICTYVAQNNGKSEGDPERREYYNYLAVKNAEIRCRFAEDVGKLILVDTIGLGDTQYGIDGAMLDTVDKVCDSAIVVTKPDSGIKDQDQVLYELLRNRFRQRDMSKWLFYLANVQPGFNANAVDSFVNEVLSRNFVVADCVKINCKNQESVRRDFFIPMLSTLVANMDDIDAAYIDEVNGVLGKLKEALAAAVSAFPSPEAVDFTRAQDLQIHRQGEEFYSRFADSLASTAQYWYTQRDKPNATLWNRVKDILDSLDSTLPDAETLQAALEKRGSLMEYDLWKVPLNYVRNEITDQFISVDGLMERETLEFKNSMVHELYISLRSLVARIRGNDAEAEALEENAEEDAAGSSDADADADGAVVDETRWLWEGMEPLLRDKPEYSQIYKAFQFLNQFEFNVRAQLIQEVRNQLRIINPMTLEYYMRPVYDFRRENVGQAVHFFMTSRLAILEDGLRHSLALMNKMPNRAYYAAAEEFYDRLTFSSDFKSGKFVDMRSIWGNFFTEYSNLIWAKEREKTKAVEVISKKFEQYRGTVRTAVDQLA